LFVFEPHGIKGDFAESPSDHPNNSSQNGLSGIGIGFGFDCFEPAMCVFLPAEL
jgi:hypothetical protein